MQAPSGKESAGNSLSQPLDELGIVLPAPPTPLGAYVESSASGNLLFLSGTLPVVNCKLAIAGRLGEQILPGCFGMRQLGTLPFKCKKPILFPAGWLAVLFLNLASPCVCNGGFEINTVSVE